MAVRIALLSLFLVGCLNQKQGLLFDRKYASLCEAMDDITHHALKVHISKSPEDFSSVRTQATKKMAADVGYKGELPSIKDCQDIKAISQFRTNKTEQENYSTALSYFMKELDPHSSYTPQSNVAERKRYEENINHGIGIEAKYIHEVVQMTIPLETIVLDYIYKDTPAYSILKEGDEIEAINGEEVHGKLFKEILEILAKDSDSLELKIKRLPDPLLFSQIEFKKPLLYARSIKSEGKHLVYIRISHFASGVSKQLQYYLEKMSRSNVEGLILDLRGNPGGQIQEAGNILNMLLTKKGEAFHTEGAGKTSKKLNSFNASGKAIYVKPIVVLVDSNTASAAEIVAGALQTQSRALIIGTDTYGKASVQDIEPVSTLNGFGGILYTTTALIYYPNEKTHQIRGVIPDRSVQDEPYQQALETLKEKNIHLVLNEKQYANAIVPHGYKTQIADNSQSPYDEASNENSLQCGAIPSSKCLETYATGFLKSMINR